MYRVALVGHSNLPEISSWDNVRVESFKERGAELTDLIGERRFGEALYTTHWDCVILFLGGNDLANWRDQDTVYDRFMSVYASLQYERLMVTELEPRTYNWQREIRHGITTARYNALAKVVNKKLKRHASHNRARIQLIHVPPGYMIGSRDGIHLSTFGEEQLIQKYRRVINAYRLAVNQ